MNEHFKSLDETIVAIKADCAAQLKAMGDKLMAAEIEAALSRDLLTKSNETKDAYMRVAERLITQFSTVEKVFSEAKVYALTLPKAEEPVQADHPLLPVVTP